MVFVEKTNSEPKKVVCTRIENNVATFRYGSGITEVELVHISKCFESTKGSVHRKPVIGDEGFLDVIRSGRSSWYIFVKEI